ncbi:MAG: signal peptidase I [Lentisphaeria bacterium]|nr:signal peptidase I [Lentisphaeria bacterium]
MKNFFQKIISYRLHSKCRKTIRKFVHLLDYDDDILSENQKKQLHKCADEGTELLKTNDFESIRKYNSNADEKISNILNRSNAWLRETLDILAVALAVAFGIRALFFQPFKIPTGSMQPTLFGIHFMAKEPLGNRFAGKFGSFFDNILFACERAYLQVQKDGVLESYSPVKSLFSTKTSLRIGGVDYILPGTIQKIVEYTGLEPDRIYKKGDILCDGYLSSGDHLFVDRLSHYLFGLKRGDIVVFTTENIFMDGEPLAKSSGFYYVKRLVGLPGDTLKIINDTLYVREKGSETFRPIAEISDKFKKIYTRCGGYQGHSNIVGYSTGEYLKNPFDEFTVPKDTFFMLGDNSKFSADSRMWGVVHRRNIVGRPVLVFWPFSRRWGTPDRAEPLPMKTGNAQNNTFKEMYQQ